MSNPFFNVNSSRIKPRGKLLFHYWVLYLGLANLSVMTPFIELANSADPDEIQTRTTSTKIAPGPPVTCFKKLWGYYPELKNQGPTHFLEQMSQEYGPDGTPVRVEMGPLSTIYVISH